MKQQDIGIVIIIVFFAAIFSYVLSNKYITPSSKKLNAQVVKPITPDFTLPDSKVFNPDAINPTGLIEIAPNANNQPFTNEQ